MKYASLILIYFTMLGTWKVINQANPVSEVVHVGIQEDLKRVIENYIKENLPESKDLNFHRLWTELKAPNQVKATFMYSFADDGEESGKTRVEIEGYAILNRDKTKNDTTDVWSFDELYILNNHVIFDEGITITPSDSDELDTYIAIDEFGYFVIDKEQITDPVIGRQLFENLNKDDRGRHLTKTNGQTALVECFDRPIVGLQIEPVYKDQWLIKTHYDVTYEFSLSHLKLDEWDRFIGFTTNGFEFVLSESAHGDFFDLLDSYGDDEITFQGKVYPTPPYFQTEVDVNTDDFWNKIYQTEVPRWELNEPAAPLKDILPQLKLPKSRIAVLGCGSGNDAAYFASQGHIVTAIDFSAEAISEGEKKYSQVKNLEFLQADIFDLDPTLFHQFDIVYEHTCYVAVNPDRRDELVKVWKKLLHNDGQFLAIFLLGNQTTHPPFASNEWELRQRLEKDFFHLYWTRWQRSIERRAGKELVVFSNFKET